MFIKGEGKRNLILKINNLNGKRAFTLLNAKTNMRQDSILCVNNNGLRLLLIANSFAEQKKIETLAITFRDSKKKRK